MRDLARFLLFALLGASLAACGAPGTAPPPYADAGRADAHICGAMTCGPNELCVQVCVGGPLAGPWKCVPAPATCPGGTVTCGCLPADVCQCGQCQSVSVSSGTITCQCTCV